MKGLLISSHGGNTAFDIATTARDLLGSHQGKRMIYKSNNDKVVFVHQGRATRPWAYNDLSDSIHLAMHASAAAKAENCLVKR